MTHIETTRDSTATTSETGMEGFTYARGTRGGKTGGGIMETVWDDEHMCDLDSDDELDHVLVSDIPLSRPGSNRFVPPPVPIPVPLPPHRNFFDRLRMAAGMEADYRNMLIKYARSWFWRSTRIYPFRRQGASSLAYSMKEIAEKTDLGHQKTIEDMQTQPLRIQLFKQLSKPRPQSRKRAVPESDSEEEEELDEGEENEDMIVVKAPTRRSSGRTIRKPQKYAYPTPPATSDDEEEDTNAVPDADQQDEPEENEDEEDEDEEDEEEEEEEEEERKPAPKRRRTGHIEGIDRKTGQRTLVGTFLPRIDENGRYWCRDEECNRIIKQGNWGTKNGYKYHLRECCLQNPNSKRRRAMAEVAEMQEEEEGEELKRKVRGKEMSGMS
jgi:hypothetical protein